MAGDAPSKGLPSESFDLVYLITLLQAVSLVKYEPLEHAAELGEVDFCLHVEDEFQYGLQTTELRPPRPLSDGYGLVAAVADRMPAAREPVS